MTEAVARASHKLVHEYVWAPLLVGALLFARFAPETAFSRFFCPFRMITELPCLACGGTRATRAFVHFDWPTAFVMNPLVAVGAMVGVIYVLHALMVMLKARPPWRIDPKSRTFTALRAPAVVAVVVNWAYLIAVGR